MKLCCALLWTVSALFAQKVAGTVTNSITGMPVPGVTVTVAAPGRSGHTAATDAQGAFRFENIPDGQYTANFAMAGFLPPGRQALPKPFRVTSGSDPVRLDMQLTPMPKVSGRVFDTAGRPVAGAGL